LHFAQRGRPFAAAGTRFFVPQEGQAAMAAVDEALTPPVCLKSHREQNLRSRAAG